MESEPKTEWKRATAFAEFAEAVGVTTLDVCAVWSRNDETIAVLYQRESDPYMIEATLGRYADGILRRVRANTITNLTVESIMRGQP